MYSQSQRFIATLLLFCILLQSCGNNKFSPDHEHRQAIAAQDSKKQEISDHRPERTHPKRYNKAPSHKEDLVDPLLEEKLIEPEADTPANSPFSPDHEHWQAIAAQDNKEQEISTSKSPSQALSKALGHASSHKEARSLPADTPIRNLAQQPSFSGYALERQPSDKLTQSTSIPFRKDQRLSQQPIQSATAQRQQRDDQAAQPAQTCTAALGKKVQFKQVDGQWEATVILPTGGFFKGLPVVCGHGEVQQALEELQAQDKTLHKYRVHVLPETTEHPPLVYLGRLGLLGGGNILVGGNPDLPPLKKAPPRSKELERGEEDRRREEEAQRGREERWRERESAHSDHAAAARERAIDDIALGYEEYFDRRQSCSQRSRERGLAERQTVNAERRARAARKQALYDRQRTLRQARDRAAATNPPRAQKKKGFWSSIWGGVKSIANTVWNGVTTTASTMWEGVKAASSTMWEGVKAASSTMWEGVKAASSTMWEGVKAASSTMWEGVKKVGTWIKENPGKALAVGAIVVGGVVILGSGVGLGALWGANLKGVLLGTEGTAAAVGAWSFHAGWVNIVRNVLENIYQNWCRNPLTVDEEENSESALRTQAPISSSAPSDPVSPSDQPNETSTQPTTSRPDLGEDSSIEDEAPQHNVPNSAEREE